MPLLRRPREKLKLAAIALLAAGSIVAAALACTAPLWPSGYDPVGLPDVPLYQQRLNINTADAEHLCRLDGIGPVKAQAIVDYRSRNGSFSCVEELAEVSGISDAMVERLRNSICVE